MSGKPRHLTKNGRVRGPAFTPTDAQRRLVAQLIGLHVTWSEIQQLVIHPKTGEPISRKTLAKYFRRELAAGGAMLKQLAASKYFQALEAGESWAVRMAMRNRFGWVVEGSAPVPAEVLSAPVDEPTLRVSFVLPIPGKNQNRRRSSTQYRKNRRITRSRRCRHPADRRSIRPSERGGRSSIAGTAKAGCAKRAPPAG